jgi:hypothetical protein
MRLARERIFVDTSTRRYDDDFVVALLRAEVLEENGEERADVKGNNQE